MHLETSGWRVIFLMRAILSSSDCAILMAAGFRHWSMT
jgi:hypothetical protein